jgi:hypothetical protein
MLDQNLGSTTDIPLRPLIAQLAVSQLGHPFNVGGRSKGTSWEYLSLHCETHVDNIHFGIVPAA